MSDDLGGPGDGVDPDGWYADSIDDLPVDDLPLFTISPAHVDRSFGPFLPGDIELLGHHDGLDLDATWAASAPGPAFEPFDLAALGIEVDGAWVDPGLLAFAPDPPGAAPLETVRVGGDGAVPAVIARIWPLAMGDAAPPGAAHGGLDVAGALSALEASCERNEPLASVVAAVRGLAS